MPSQSSQRSGETICDSTGTPCTAEARELHQVLQVVLRQHEQHAPITAP